MTVESNYAIAIAIHLVIGLKDSRQFALLIKWDKIILIIITRAMMTVYGRTFFVRCQMPTWNHQISLFCNASDNKYLKKRIIYWLAKRNPFLSSLLL